MKSGSKTAARVDDLWSILDKTVAVSEEESSDTTILFVGDSQSGKTSIIQGFLKPTAAKDPKPTFALDYNFARRKNPNNPSAPKSVSHLWELGGDISEPSLLDVPISLREMLSTSVVICCDLSKTQNIFASTHRWIKLIRDVVARKLKQAQNGNSALISTLKENAAKPYVDHIDRSRVKPCELPLYIVCTKYDQFKNLGFPDRRVIIQSLRFLAHYYGATLMCTSSLESGLREAVRNLVSSISFRTSLRQAQEVALEKPLYVSVGKDTFESILSVVKGADASESSAISGAAPKVSHFSLVVPRRIKKDGITHPRHCPHPHYK